MQSDQKGKAHDRGVNEITIQNRITIISPDSQVTLITSLSSTQPDYIATAHEDNQIRIWDLKTGLQYGNSLVGHTDSITQITGGGHRFLSCSKDNTICAWQQKCTTSTYQSEYGHHYDTEWNEYGEYYLAVKLIGHTDIVMGVLYSKDSEFIVSCSGDKSIHLWKMENGQGHVDRQFKHINSIFCLAQSPDEKEIAFGDDQGQIMIWKYEQHPLTAQQFQGHKGRVIKIQYSADGRSIISIGDDLTINLRYKQSVSNIQKSLPNSVDLRTLALSSDANCILTAGQDNLIRLFDRSTGKQIGQSLNHHKNEICAASFNQDGHEIMTAGHDNQIIIGRIVHGVNKPLDNHAE